MIAGRRRAIVRLDSARTLHFIRRSNTRCIASKPTLTSFHKVFGPSVIQALGDAFLATQLSSIEAFRGAHIAIMVQEFIKEAGGSDIRGLVVGGKVVAAMKRQGAEGEFRSNLHRGGSAQLIKITPEERSTAVRAAKAMGLNVCRVDLLRSNHGPVIMEVNSSSGLEGIEEATGKDIAGQMIEFTESNAKRGKTKTRGHG